jgi:hypothetical protein
MMGNQKISTWAKDDPKLLDDSGKVPKPNGGVGILIPDYEVVPLLDGTNQVVKHLMCSKEEKEEDTNMLPVELENTWISTNYAQNLASHWCMKILLGTLVLNIIKIQLENVKKNVPVVKRKPSPSLLCEMLPKAVHVETVL